MKAAITDISFFDGIAVGLRLSVSQVGIVSKRLDGLVCFWRAG